PATAGIGSHQITYSAGGCSADVSIPVIVSDTPVVNAGGPGLVASPGNPVTINASSDQQGTYLWSPATGLSSATVLNPQASPSQTTLYTLTVTSSANCLGHDTVT